MNQCCISNDIDFRSHLWQDTVNAICDDDNIRAISFVGSNVVSDYIELRKPIPHCSVEQLVVGTIIIPLPSNTLDGIIYIFLINLEFRNHLNLAFMDFSLSFCS